MKEGEFYHVYNRGNNRQRIFFEPKNYRYFLDKFQKYVCPYTDVYAYCLMPNHFHFLIQVHEQPFIQNPSDLLADYKSKNLSPVQKGFKDFFISYAKSINKAYHRTGSLFQSKFRRKLITDENYLSTIIPYIHLNPVRAGITCTANEYGHSSFNGILGMEHTFVKKKQVLDYFGSRNAFLHAHTIAPEFMQLINWRSDVR